MRELPRKLIVGIVIATLMAWFAVIVDLARGGRPDPAELRAAATLLDGSWRFHTGDDPLWANANADDSGWETVNMTAPPGSHDGDVGLPGIWFPFGIGASRTQYIYAIAVPLLAVLIVRTTIPAPAEAVAPAGQAPDT